jgi:hypothetical protein
MNLPSFEAARKRLHEAIRAAAEVLEHEQKLRNDDSGIVAAYRQGRSDELERVTNLIALRLEALHVGVEFEKDTRQLLYVLDELHC